MLNIYITKLFDDALLYFNKLNSNEQTRINKQKNINKQKQMITAMVLLEYALKDSGYKGDVNVEYLPKPMLKNSNLMISKSHSNDYVAVSVSDENSGLDIEKITTVKTPHKLLFIDELKIYEKTDNKKKKDVFTMYWTAKEAYIKYYGSLTKEYKNIYFNIEKTINNINIGKIDDLFCYQSFFYNYSLAVASKKFIAPNVVFVRKEDLLNEVK